MKIAWLTDIHLNFLDGNSREQFYKKIVNTRCNSILITGDIAEAPCLGEILNEMGESIKIPIYFVLGNHDYYRSHISKVRNEMTTLTHTSNNLFWLPVCGLKQLNNETFLVGQDGWADGRLGNYLKSRVALNDNRMIADLFQENPLVEFLVLCGHTHSQANYQPLDNLTVRCGKAAYYQPEIQCLIKI